MTRTRSTASGPLAELGEPRPQLLGPVVKGVLHVGPLADAAPKRLCARAAIDGGGEALPRDPIENLCLDAGHKIIWGVGPTLVFPTASERTTGQGKWQAGPAAAIAFAPAEWLVGILAQNPISFAGDTDRKDANALFLQPFATYQLGRGWFVRTQPQMAFDWQTGKQVLPLDLGAGRVFKIGRQYVSCLVEPFWNASTNGPTPRYGVNLGVSLLYPDYWQKR